MTNIVFLAYETILIVASCLMVDDDNQKYPVVNWVALHLFLGMILALYIAVGVAFNASTWTE